MSDFSLSGIAHSIDAFFDAGDGDRHTASTMDAAALPETRPVFGLGTAAVAGHGSTLFAGEAALDLGALADGAAAAGRGLAAWGGEVAAFMSPALGAAASGVLGAVWSSALNENEVVPGVHDFVATQPGLTVLEGGGPGPQAPRTWILPEHRPAPGDGAMTNPIVSSGAWHTGTNANVLPLDVWSTPGFPSSMDLGPNVMLSQGSSGGNGGPSIPVRGFEHLPTHPDWALSKGTLAGTVTQIADALGRPKSLVLYSGSSSKALEVPTLQSGRYGTTLLKVDGVNTSDAIAGIIDQTPGIWSYDAIMGVGGGGVKDMAQTLHTTLGQYQGKGFDPNAPFVSVPTQLSTTAAGTPFAVVNGNQVIQGRRPDLTAVPIDHLLGMDPTRSQASLVSGAADYLAGLSFAAAQSHAQGLSLGPALDRYAAKPQGVLDLFSEGARMGESFHQEKYMRSLSEGFAEYATHDVPQISDEHHFYYGIEPLRDPGQLVWPTHGQSVGFGTVLQAEALGRLNGDFAFADRLRGAYGEIGIPSSLTDMSRLGVREDQIMNALINLPESSKPDRIGLLRHYIDSVPYDERPELVGDLINFRR